MSEKSIQSLATFTSSLSKDGRSDERELTERQQSFLDNLINTGGDPKEAAELAGYAEGSYTQVVKSLKREIIEQQFPGWRGVPTEEAYTTDTMTYIMEKGKDFVGPDGESIREVQKRATNWLEDELIYNRKLCSTPQSLKVAIVGHGNTMRSIFHYIMGFDQRLMYKIGVDNTSISRFIFNSKGWSVVCLNDNSHLRTGSSGTFEARS